MEGILLDIGLYGVTVSTRNSVVLFLSLFLLSRTERAAAWQVKRRLISLIFAGRNRIIMIRRELPLTVVASPAEPVA